MIFRLPLTIVVLSLIPSALISLLFIRWNNRRELQISFYLRMMFFGALSVIPGGIIVSLTTSLKGNGQLWTYFLRPFMAVAFIEELIKLMIIILVLYRSDQFKTIKNGINYSVAIAVGFAFAENIIYLTGSGQQLGLILSRSLTAVPLHAICGAFMGYYIGLGKTQEKRGFGRALLSASLIHGLFNIIIILYFPYNLFSIILMIFSLILLKKLYNKNAQPRSF